MPLQIETGQPSVYFDTLGKNLPEPYELVAEASDAMFMHHLILHEGNHSHSANRKRRVALDGDTWHDQGLIEIDPQTEAFSLAENGRKGHILKYH